MTDKIDTSSGHLLASDERHVRRNQAERRRREGIDLDAAEVIVDLKRILDTLIRHIDQYQGRTSCLTTPGQLLAYAELVALYGMKDYPRQLEGRADVTRLWDALDKVHTGPHEWRKGAYKGNGEAVMTSIQHTAQDAILGRLTPCEDTEATEEY